MNELERFPIEALVALVERGTAIMRGDLVKYGEPQFDPHDPVLHELNRRFDKASDEVIGNMDENPKLLET